MRAYSYCFNCGPGAMSDRWVGLWRAGLKHEAGERLKRTRVTAAGKPLPGLVKRRAAEACLLVAGDYGSGTPAHEAPADYAAKIADLGYDSVSTFQRHHPNLDNDGILGPATRAQIDRDFAARREGAAVIGSAAAGVGVAAWLATQALLFGIAAGLAVAAVALWFMFRRREELTHWIRNRTG